MYCFPYYLQAVKCTSSSQDPMADFVLMVMNCWIP